VFTKAIYKDYMNLQTFGIFVVKDYRKQGKDFDEQLSQGFNFRMITYFKETNGLSSERTAVKKKLVKKVLRNLDRDAITFNINDAGIGEKERIMVFEQGNYSMDEAVYDQETKIPKHLRARTEEKVEN
jgi:hypothetical protein